MSSSLDKVSLLSNYSIRSSVFVAYFSPSLVAATFSVFTFLKISSSALRRFTKFAALIFFSCASSLATSGCLVSKCRRTLYYLGMAAVSRHTRHTILSRNTVNKYLFVHSALKDLFSDSNFLFLLSLIAAVVIVWWRFATRRITWKPQRNNTLAGKGDGKWVECNSPWLTVGDKPTPSQAPIACPSAGYRWKVEGGGGPTHIPQGQVVTRV
jgi:hypothetical protein